MIVTRRDAEDEELLVLPYLLTAIAGIAAGIVAMRIFQLSPAAAHVAEEPAPTDGGVPAPPQSMLARVRSFRPTSLHMLGAAGVMLLLAVAIFNFRGDGGAGSSALDTFTLGSGPADTQALDDVDTMISRLAARLEANPDDGEGFRMLGWSYLMTDNPDLALAPYERALELLPDDARVHSGYGEVLTAKANNTVTPEAKSAFQRALTLDPAEPRARYFLALWDAQNGRKRDALDAWLELAATNPLDTTWQADLRREIARVSGELGVDVSDRLPAMAATTAAVEMPVIDPATIAAASALPGEDRETMIQSMVEGLAARLRTSPDDPEGWIRLLRSRMVLEQAQQAGADLMTARAALANNTAGLGQLNAAASQLGVPGA